MSIHVNAGKFQKFHYNATRNMEMYGSEEAPEYDLSNISANIHILYGTNDRIAPSEVSPPKRVSYDFNWNNLLNKCSSVAEYSTVGRQIGFESRHNQ